jgi:formylmethanofuran dehydrogenase subunit E
LEEDAEEDRETERKSRKGKVTIQIKKKNMDYDEENAADIEDADERGEEELEESPETTQRANEKKLKGIYKEDIHETS